jgi:5-methylcytosine-specific restriction endonuclease McrA
VTAGDLRYTGITWRTLRRVILERDRGVCQVRGPGCTTDATAVDHIVPACEGGDFYDPANLRASCRACNSARGAATATTRNARYRGSTSRYETRL